MTAFHDDLDADQDGKVSIGERVASFAFRSMLKDRAVTEVAMSARHDMDVLMRDASFNEMAVSLYLNFARAAVLEGIWIVYFRPGVNMAGKGIAKRVTSSMIKQFAVRKGFEAAVKSAFEAGSAP